MHSFPAISLSRLPGGRPASGIVLVVALILLAVIAISSTMAMRLALSSDLIAINLRTSNLTQQAAEIALRYCEARVSAGDFTTAPAITRLPEVESTVTDHWEQAAQWTVAGNVTTVPANVLAAPNTPNPFNVLPQCMVQLKKLPPASSANPSKTVPTLGYLVTVRAFSPGYRRVNGASAGGEVWLQSYLVGAATTE